MFAAVVVVLTSASVWGEARASLAAANGDAHADGRQTLVDSGRRTLLGRSVLGRPIWAVERGDPASSVKAVVVGCIDGNETAGEQIARALESDPVPAGVDLWVIENMNPDGAASDTGPNADRVDLNRNFPWHWRRLGRPGYWQYSGTRPLSEPESRSVRAFLLRLRPRLVIWYHQPLTLVDESGGDPMLERKYARLVGLSLERLPRYPGSATSWVNHRFPGSTSFVVELRPGPPTTAAIERHAHAVLVLLRDLAGHPS
jgi:protein MpaA